jgi:3-deoxy-manno-octulosonate cytidylyltransferase (CMP-KDO synthetase)
MQYTAIIPARYASTRFPGKPLALINGQPMIRLVYDQARKALDRVFVATDDERIADAVRKFGGEVIITDPALRSGTDRCAEALRIIIDKYGIKPDVVINLQGDEPFVKPEQIRQLCDCFNNQSVEIATLIKHIENEKDLENPNIPKVVVASDGKALYFSRSVIPFMRDVTPVERVSKHKYFKHIGMYGYRAETLMKLSLLPQSDIEIAESLEQLRWLSNGLKIMTSVTSHESIGIDTPEDLEKAKLLLINAGK